MDVPDGVAPLEARNANDESLSDPLLGQQPADEEVALQRERAVGLLRQSEGKATAFGTGVNIANNIIGA
jgi:hypothetical protein